MPPGLYGPVTGQVSNPQGNSPNFNVNVQAAQPATPYAQNGLRMVRDFIIDNQEAIGDILWGGLDFTVGALTILAGFVGDGGSLTLAPVTGGGSLAGAVPSTAAIGTGVVLSGAGLARINAGLQALLQRQFYAINEGEFKLGERLIRDIPTVNGNIQVTARVGTDRITQTVVLRDFTFFEENSRKISIGVSGARDIFRALAIEAKASGFKFLRIVGTRATGANPGKALDIVVDLGNY